MGGTIIAIGLLVTMAITAYCLYHCHREPYFIRQSVYSIVTESIAASALFGISMVNGGHESFFRIGLITSCCFVMAVFVGSRSLRAYLFLLIFTFTAMISLCWYASNLLENHAYTSIKSARVVHSDTIYYLLEDLARTDRTSYPAGWLADMEFMNKYKSRRFGGRTITPQPCWHTWLTGLSRAGVMYGEAWYPGGKIRDALGRIECRQR